MRCIICSIKFGGYCTRNVPVNEANPSDVEFITVIRSHAQPHTTSRADFIWPMAPLDIGKRSSVIVHMASLNSSTWHYKMADSITIKLNWIRRAQEASKCTHTCHWHLCSDPDKPKLVTAALRLFLSTGIRFRRSTFFLGPNKSPADVRIPAHRHGIGGCMSFRCRYRWNKLHFHLINVPNMCRQP